MINILYLFKFLECGHFCINYVLKKDNKKKKIRYCKQMMSLALVKKVLKEYYDNCECYFVNNIEGLKGKKRFITLIQVRGNHLHYVVVNLIKNNYIYYYDPLFITSRKVKLSKFENKWSKYCCFFA